MIDRQRKLKTINGECIIGVGNIEITGGGGHTHTNKALLDTYTETNVNLASAVSLKHSNANDHTHSNITALNNVSGVNTGDQDLSGKADVSHSHSQSEITGLVNDLSGKEPANVNIQAHIASVHAPSNAQKNSDITKAEIEAKLTGEILSHTHAGGSVPRTAAGAYALLPNDTLAQDYLVNKVTKLTVTANRTLTTTVPPAGSEAFTIILTSGTTSRTITFGTGFKPVGTLATGTVTARVFVVHWISDGTNLYEAGRTTAMAG